MKIPILCLILFVFAPSVYSQTSPVEYKDLESFRKNGTGEVWRNVVVSPKIKRDELIALAKFLHDKHHGVPFRIFTDDAKFVEFMERDIHYPDPAYTYPEKWASKHYVARIQSTSNDGGRTRQWFLWAVSSAAYKFVRGDGEVIADLD
jgi:hypothetical protein